MNDELRNEVVGLLSKNIRLDGRKPDEYREIFVETGVSKNAEGSARVRIGDTEVIAGVKMEIMKPYPDQPDEGSMMVNVELYPMASPEFEAGPPDNQAIELARITDRGIRESKTLDTHKLCIKAGESAWMVVVDVCTINDCGNLFDAISLAALVAMKDAVYPSYDGTKLDFKKKTTQKLPLTRMPVTVTVFKYGDYLAIDPTNEEQKVYDARLTVTVLENGNICSLQKGGDKAVTPEEAIKMVEFARKKSLELRQHI
jgi:exosome complex component RRP42